MLSLLRMELLKLSKRPMTWILLVLLVGFLGFGATVSVLTLGDADPARRERVLDEFTLPGMIPNTLNYTYSIGSVLLAILAGAAIGAEYGWGTPRSTLSTGVPRGRFLLAKALALLVVAIAFLLVTLAAGVALAIPMALLNGRALTFGAVDAAWFGAVALMLGRTTLGLLVPMAIVFFFGVLGRSQAIGIGAALGLLIAEGIVAEVLGLLGERGVAAIELLIGTSNQTLQQHNTFGEVATSRLPIGEGRAVLTLVVYGLVCLVGAALLFRRRDIRGAA